MFFSHVSSIFFFFTYFSIHTSKIVRSTSMTLDSIRRASVKVVLCAIETHKRKGIPLRREKLPNGPHIRSPRAAAPELILVRKMSEYMMVSAFNFSPQLATKALLSKSKALLHLTTVASIQKRMVILLKKAIPR